MSLCLAAPPFSLSLSLSLSHKSAAIKHASSSYSGRERSSGGLSNRFFLLLQLRKFIIEKKKILFRIDMTCFYWFTIRPKIPSTIFDDFAFYSLPFFKIKYLGELTISFPFFNTCYYSCSRIGEPAAEIGRQLLWTKDTRKLRMWKAK
jgi:hypothetical protein